MEFNLGLEAGLGNAWWMCLPFLLVGMLVSTLRTDVARRMADMTGYTRTERLFTIGASLVPYPFMALCIFTPFTANTFLLVAGGVIYTVGMVIFASTTLIFLNTPSGQPLLTGPYRFSRNPLYVSASLVFLGITLATSHVLLIVLLVFMVFLQHFMILAEERSCMERFGATYREYMQRVPRYGVGL